MLQLGDIVKTVKNKANTERHKENEIFPEAPAIAKIIGVSENGYDIIFAEEPFPNFPYSVFTVSEEDLEFVEHEKKD